MDLERFMQATDTTDAELAEIVKRDRSTISRIRRKVVVPNGVTLTLLNAWANELRRGPPPLSAECRLTWLHLSRPRRRAR
jgi:hypothetical protein